MLFRKLTLHQWQQFDTLDVEFHPRLTVLTGANASGKTTLLRFLARHFGGWSFVYLRTPLADSERGFRYWFSTFLKGGHDRPAQIGTIVYDNGAESAIRLPKNADQPSYEITIDRPGNVPGFFLPSHRQEFRYQRLENLSLATRKWRSRAFDVVHGSIRSYAMGQGGQHPIYQMKEVLVSLAHFGYDSLAVVGDSEARRLFEGFQETLRIVLPPDLGFRSIAIRDRSEVVIQSNSGEFLLDAVSGGIGALIELCWQIYMFSPPEDGGYTVVIDEPENHLHARMQRHLLPSLLEAFPKAQFVVATHSPLVVGSVRESNVYALRFTEQRGVRSERLELFDKSAAAEDVLREVLGVDVTMPIWAENALNELMRRYLARPLSVESARELRKEMIDAGLVRWLPEVVSRIADGQQQPA